ncbi:MAG: hypothetical protein QXR06_05350 [Candidatus Bathyarchaeia archaeon]
MNLIDAVHGGLRMTGEGRERQEERIDKVIIDVAEEVMLNVFGRRGLESIIRVLRERHGLDLDEMPDKPHIFSEALHEIIGVSSVIIEDLIIENLYMRLGLEFHWKKGYKFPDYINEAKNYISLNPGKVSE